LKFFDYFIYIMDLASDILIILLDFLPKDLCYMIIDMIIFKISGCKLKRKYSGRTTTFNCITTIINGKLYTYDIQQKLLEVNDISDQYCYGRRSTMLLYENNVYVLDKRTIYIFDNNNFQYLNEITFSLYIENFVIHDNNLFALSHRTLHISNLSGKIMHSIIFDESTYNIYTLNDHLYILLQNDKILKCTNGGELIKTYELYKKILNIITIHDEIYIFDYISCHVHTFKDGYIGDIIMELYIYAHQITYYDDKLYTAVRYEIDEHRIRIYEFERRYYSTSAYIK